MFHEACVTYYQALFDRLQHHLEMAVAYYDPEAIHEMRVEIKRLRAFFRLIEWMVPIFQAKKNVRHIRQLFKAAAGVRDMHVQQELAWHWAHTLNLDLSAYHNQLKHQELRARRDFLRFAKTFPLFKEGEQHKRVLQQALISLSEEAAAEKIRARVMDLLTGLLEFARETRLQAEHLHTVRILTKEARYTLHVARHCFPEAAYSNRLDQRLQSVHQALGNWHDADLALTHLTVFHETYPEGQVYEIVRDSLFKEKTRLLRSFKRRWKTLVNVLETTIL